MAASQTVLVTGGAGAVGLNLVGGLLRRGHRVRVLDAAPFDAPERAQIEQITGDPADAQAVERALAGVDAVVHLAAPESAAGVIEAAYARDIGRFVYLSSSSVYGLPRHKPVEDARRLGESATARAHISAEDALFPYRRRGMSVPVLRAQPLVGPYQRQNFARAFEQAVKGSHISLRGRGDYAYQLLAISDLCAALYAALEGQFDTVNDTFNLGAAEYTTLKADLGAVLDHAGHGQRVIRRPFSPPLIPDEAALAESALATDRAVKALGFAPRLSNRQALIQNYDWYIGNMHRFEA